MAVDHGYVAKGHRVDPTIILLPTVAVHCFFFLPHYYMHESARGTLVSRLQHKSGLAPCDDLPTTCGRYKLADKRTHILKSKTTTPS